MLRDLESTVTAMDGYRPKGPFPLFIKDLREDTIGWDGAARWRYLCVLEHMFHQGGYIPDDLVYLAEISGTNRARNWRETLEKLRYILLKSEKKPGFLTNKRVLVEVEKANKRSGIASTGGKAKAKKKVAVSTAEKVLPTPTPKESKKESTLSGAKEKPLAKPAPPPKEAADAKPTKTKKRGTRLPPDWKPDNTDITYAQGRSYNILQIERLGEGMQANADAKGTLSRDWHASFRMWVIRDLDFHGPPGSRKNEHGRTDGNGDGFAATAIEVAARMEAHGSGLGDTGGVHGGGDGGGRGNGQDVAEGDHDADGGEGTGEGIGEAERPDEAAEG